MIMSNKKGNRTPTLEISKKTLELNCYFITALYDVKLISFQLSI